ncbi:MAG: DMT family transporter [Aestuariivita sp.]|nr:DMT family transporter [Aestuariivita sp.]
MSLWVPFTLMAALFQTVRFMLQKFLSMKTLSAAGTTFARFIYSFPIIAIALLFFFLLSDREIPVFTLIFFMFVVIGGLSQILATVLVILLFKLRNFAVGITFKKTEVVLSVLAGIIILGEGVSLTGFVAILLGIGGVLLLSKTPSVDGQWWKYIASRSVLLGVGSGFLFAVSAVCYRGATLQLMNEPLILRAGITLCAVVFWQVIAMSFWLFCKDPKQIIAVWQARAVGLWVGLTSLCGSFCWFVAFAIQNAAYVKALGQIELVFSILASVLFFQEVITSREVLGIALLVSSVLALIFVI